MSRPRSANQGPKKILLVNKGQDSYRNFIPPESLPNIKFNNYADDQLSEELAILKNSWDDLGVTNEYRKAFMSHLKQVNEYERIDIIKQEKNNLKRFRDALLKLKKEITNREDNLLKLKNLNKELGNVNYNEGEMNSRNNILQNVIVVIKALRMNAINIVSKIIKVNQLSAYYSNSGKWDVTRIKPDYSYDPKYLTKMKDDLVFLRSSTLSNYIEMNNSDIDAFLTNCAPAPNKANSDKIKIPIADDIMKLITESRYALLQEAVISSVEEDRNYKMKRSDILEGNYKRGSSMNKIRYLEEEKYKMNNPSFKINVSNAYNNSKIKNNYDPYPKNMSKYLLELKNLNGKNRYNHLFYKNSSVTGVNKFRNKNKLFSNNPNYNNKNNNIYGNRNRIAIEHEEIQSLSNEEFLRRLGNLKESQNNVSKIRLQEQEEPNNNEEELNNIKNDNQQQYEQEINILREKVQELEQKAKDDEIDAENLRSKCKELTQREKEHKSEVEKIQKNNKKKVAELNKKIEDLQKENQKMKDDEKEKEKIEEVKNEMKKKEDELMQKIKDLENKLKNEENERKNKEKENEDLEKKLKEKDEEKSKIEKDKEDLEKNLKEKEEEKSKLEKDKEDLEKNLNEEKEQKENEIKKREDLEKKLEESEKNQKLSDEQRVLEYEQKIKKLEEEKSALENEKNIESEIKNKLENEKNALEREKNSLENEIKKKDQIIRDKEEENQKIILEKSKIEDEKNEINNKYNELEKDNAKQTNEINELKEQIKKLNDQIKNLNDQIKKLNDQIDDLNKKNQELEQENAILKKKGEKNIDDGCFEEVTEKVKEERVEKDDDEKLKNKNIEKQKKVKPAGDINPATDTAFEGEAVPEKKVEKEEKEEIVQNKDLEEEQDQDKVPLEEPQPANYKIGYYKGNISNLMNSISDNILLEQIPDFIRRAFALDDSIYSDDYYFKGVFPKIIVSSDASQEGDETGRNIKGICSFYYDNENFDQNIIIRINSIFAAENYEEQIKKMIEYIQNEIKYDRLEVYLLYDKEGEKFLPNKEAKKIFQDMGFKWLCVVREEKQQQRYIKLTFGNKSEEIQYEGKNNFVMDNLSVVTVLKEDDAYYIKNIIDNSSSDDKLYKVNYSKFINPNPVYSLLLDNTHVTKEFKDEQKRKELEEMKQQLWRFVIAENGWNLIEEEKKKIKKDKIKFDIKKSVFRDIEKVCMRNEKIDFLYDFYKTNLSLNFENTYSILYEDIYYNRISTDKIKILKEKKTNTLFFLIPSYDNTALFYVAQVNNKLKDLLIDTNQNVYEKFFEFQPGTQKELFEYSLTSYRDITYIPPLVKKDSKTIYIPCFSINTHLFSYNFREIYKNVKITDTDTNTPSYLTSAEEFINVHFKPDENINNSFNVIPVTDGKTNVIIEDSFIIGIFDNDIINKDKLPLLQFLYVTKDNFLTPQNYNVGQ